MSVASFVDSLSDLIGADEPLGSALVAAARAVSDDAQLSAKLEVALRRFNDVPREPPDRGSLRRLWALLRDFVHDRTRKELLVTTSRDGFKASTVHIMAEQFGLLHVSLPQGAAVRVYRKGAADASEPRADPHWDADDRMYFDTIKRFLANESMTTFNFPSYLTSDQRQKVYRIAALFSDLEADSFGSKRDRERYVRITKVDHQKKRRLDLVSNALNDILEVAPPTRGAGPASYNVDACLTLAPSTDTVRFVTWNVQWMDTALDSDVARIVRAARVIRELAPSALAIQEGPATLERMQAFVTEHLDDAYTVFGGLEQLRQQVYVLVRRHGPLADPQLHQPSLAYLSQPWQFDCNGDRVLLASKFARRPVVVRCKLGAQTLYLFAVHMKSMKISNGEQMCRTDMDKFIQVSIRNRRRIGAECHRVRQCVEEVIFSGGSDDNPHVVIMGDLNTGPGRDFFERFYLLFDVVDVLEGSTFDRRRRLFSPLVDLDLSQCWSALFRDCMDGQAKHVLVDHIFATRSLKRAHAGAGIAHDIFMRNGEPSDHRPVWFDVKHT